MIEQQGQQPDPGTAARRRRVEGAGFLVGLLGSLAFLAFFPGLPHVIDWGAVLVSLAVGALVRWGCRSWTVRRSERGDGSGGG
ncbi:hypothetical protein ACIF8T_31230 [Streptomyces sp. NPDC085946]|uniref:hypothetical protein n=1 Tax=Streptomyces sp. NPDC085946 TaxID=3365744 RepID=UPI0037D358AC